MPYTILHPNSPRYKTFLKIFNTNRIPIKSLWAEFTDVPGYSGTLVYFLDLSQLSMGQLFRLKAYLCKVREIKMETLNAEIERFGVPVLYNDLQFVLEDWQEVTDDHHLRHV